MAKSLFKIQKKRLDSCKLGYLQHRINHLSLGCLQEAHIHSGLPPPFLVMESLAAQRKCCPFATCKHCLLDDVALSGSLPENSPRSTPAPLPCRSPQSSQTQCVLSLVESETATRPENTINPALLNSKCGECAVGWRWWFSYLSWVVTAWGHRQISRSVWWSKSHLHRTRLKLSLEPGSDRKGLSSLGRGILLCEGPLLRGEWDS